MNCDKHPILNESDVEQKLILPLVTDPAPEGMGYFAADLHTKPSIRRFKIGKGPTSKMYYPDYVVVLAGLPVMIIEAKGPKEGLPEALREARLYAAEINAQYDPGNNPCKHLLVCNGEELWYGVNDSDTPTIVVPEADFHSASAALADVQNACSRRIALVGARRLREQQRSSSYRRPRQAVGGGTFQREELAENTFGATIAGDYGHIFNPRSRQDRRLVSEKAYIASHRRQRYIEPIDRLIRNAVAPSARSLKAIRDTSKPDEVVRVLERRRGLENQLLLLVGSVGAGKSTFVDYLSMVALPEELREHTIWARVNLNEAPLNLDEAYAWLRKKMIEQLRECLENPDDLATLLKVFSVEVNKLRRGPLSLLDPESSEYKTRLTDRLIELTKDGDALLKGMSRHLCGDAGRLLIVALDNCDKRTRDDQLRMFQVAQWLRSEYRCLVILPIRDVTFDLYRNEPPIDTALKQFIFRIEPPTFSDVLQRRVSLALAEMSRVGPSAQQLSYTLPNGYKVTYPARDQEVYLASILRSLYAHDRFVRQVITGLAGRDVRKALEMFLDFCRSGHIGEDEIAKIRFEEGRYELPLATVARVLLRTNRRYYDSDASYLKNLFQSDPNDPLPDHFVRCAILEWLDSQKLESRTGGVQGFHMAGELIQELAAEGHSRERIYEDLIYLARQGCVVAEHLRSDEIAENDLVKITSAGVVHLQLVANPEYVAACAEDTFMAESRARSEITARLLDATYLEAEKTLLQAADFSEYLTDRSSEFYRGGPGIFKNLRLYGKRASSRATIATKEAIGQTCERLHLGNLPYKITKDELEAFLENESIRISGLDVPPDHNKGGNRGFAFCSPGSADDALALLKGSERLLLAGRQVRVRLAQPPRKAESRRRGFKPPHGPRSTRLFVSGLSLAMNKNSVIGLFETRGFKIADCYTLNDPSGGFSGRAFVQFRTVDEASAAMAEMDGLLQDGTVRLRLRPAKPRKGKPS